MANKACNLRSAVMFVQRFRNDAEIVARQLDVPTENILGLAAQESKWGDGRIASQYNNYFSMHAPAPLQSGEVHPLGSSTTRVATFSSFLASAQSFATRFGHAVRGKKDPQDFVRALVTSGFNSGKSSNGGRDGFERYCLGIILSVRERMNCQ